MKNTRILAALLIVVGAVCYAGMILEALPAISFFFGTACYLAGGALLWTTRGKTDAAPIAQPDPGPSPVAPTVEMSLPNLGLSDREDAALEAPEPD